MRLTAELTADRHHAFGMVWTYQTVPETARMTVNGATDRIVTIEGRTTGIGTGSLGGSEHRNRHGNVTVQNRRKGAPVLDLRERHLQASDALRLIDGLMPVLWLLRICEFDG